LRPPSKESGFISVFSRVPSADGCQQKIGHGGAGVAAKFCWQTRREWLGQIVGHLGPAPRVS